MAVDEWCEDYWINFIDYLIKRDIWYEGFNPRKSKAIQRNSLIKGITYSFRIRKKHGEVLITIENMGLLPSQRHFDKLELNKEKITSVIGHELIWKRAMRNSTGKGTDTSRISLILPHPEREYSDWWQEHFEEMFSEMEKFRLAFSDYF